MNKAEFYMITTDKLNKLLKERIGTTFNYSEKDGQQVHILLTYGRGITITRYVLETPERKVPCLVIRMMQVNAITTMFDNINEEQLVALLKAYISIWKQNEKI